MRKITGCAICLVLLIAGYDEVLGLSRWEGWGAGGSRWSEEKCPESIRKARAQAKADVKTFKRRHPSGLWSGFVASFGAKQRMCGPSIRRAYLSAARRIFDKYRPARKYPWEPTDGHGRR